MDTPAELEQPVEPEAEAPGAGGPGAGEPDADGPEAAGELDLEVSEPAAPGADGPGEEGPEAGAPRSEGEGEPESGEPGAGEGEVAPPVVAVLVTDGPAPGLDEALTSLAAQDYPALVVLVLDNGSADDPTPRVAAAMPRAFVRRLARNVGFAAAVNEAIVAVEGATFLLLCHDDVALAPDAVTTLVHEAFRSNAGVVGPKLVRHDRPDELVEVGLAIDHYGVPFSPIEPGEIDQEQHDAVRDVFFVSDAVMLVRADLFRELGGFDPATVPGSADIDLCWRARLAGARVLVAPDARARHRGISPHQRRAQKEQPAAVRDATRARIRSLVKSYSALALVWVLPTAFVLDLAEAIGLVLTRRARTGAAVLGGWWATVADLPALARARRATQQLRRVDDGDVRDLMVRGSARARVFLTQRLHAGDRLAHVSRRTRAAVGDARAHLRARPVVLALVLAALLVAGGRSLVLDGVPAVGELAAWPGLGELWATFTSPWRYALAGAEDPATPAYAVMAGLTALFLGDGDVARTFVVAGALPLGAWGAYRVARPFAAAALPGVACAIAYGANPIARNAVAEGQLGALVCFAVAPFVLAAVVRASTRDAGRRDRVHSIVAVAALSAIAATVWVPALLLAPAVAVAFTLAVPLVRETRVAARAAALAAVAAVVAAVLLAPWSLALVGADAATYGALPRAALGAADVLSFQTGRAGSGLASFGLLVAAALPLAVATGERLAWAARAWMLALVSFAATWLPARLDPDAATLAPEAVLVPAALGLAFATGLGVAAFIEELRSFHFGWRQLVALAAAAGLALPLLGLAADTVDGRWRLPDEDWAQRFAWMPDEVQSVGGFRVLWLGDPAVLPTGVKAVDGVGYGLTRDGPGDATETWLPAENGASETLARAIATTRAGETVRFGHLVAPLGVRYVAVVSRAAPGAGARAPADAALGTALASQLDLSLSRTEDGAVLYENLAFVARRAVLPEGVELPVGEDPLVAAQLLPTEQAEPVTGPVSASAPAGPGTLLWAEAAAGGWQAEVGGERLERADALGWTNGFALPSRGSVALRFDGGWARLLLYVQLAVWLAAAAAWIRTRRGAGPASEGEEP